MPVRQVTEADVEQLNTRKYPNPYFDLANNFIPKNIKTLFKFCKAYFYTNGFLRNVVTKLTEYPITDILYARIDPATKEIYDIALHEKLNIRRFLIEIGLDYFTFGNAFISFNLQFKRFLKCTVCNDVRPIDEADYKFRNFKFELTLCPNCQTRNAIAEIEDEEIKSIDTFNLVKWDPINLDIDYNQLTGKSTYYYNIPSSIRTKIISGDKITLKETPKVFIDAIEAKKQIELNSDNIYHFKRPTLAEDDMGWGKPIILPALKELYYLQTLRRGNEAIANEHIVPKKAIFPANTTSMDPFSMMNLGKWSGEIQTQIKKWKVDPNYIGVFPIPIGYQELGGNARTLLLTPELKFIEESVINSLGVPLEFIKGGTTWTGSSISLRIVENHFLVYRDLLSDFLNFFVIRKLTRVLDYPAVKVHFKDLRMTDDTESKQLALNLNAANKISDDTLLDQLGYNPQHEAEAKKQSFADALAAEIETQETQAEGQGRAQVILARYQSRAAKAQEDEIFKIRAELFQDELNMELGAIPDDPVKLIEQYAYQMLSLPEAQARKELQQMAIKLPVTYSLVTERIQMMMTTAPANVDEEIQTVKQNTAPNQQTPGTREKDKVEIKGERHKAPTKGQPN